MYTSIIFNIICGGLLLALVDAAPAPHFIARHRTKSALQGLRLIQGSVKTSSYIVKLNDAADRKKHMKWATGLVANSTATNSTTPTAFNATYFNGYAAELDDDAVSQLLASDAVDWVEEDGIMRAFASVTQEDATWGLSRVARAAPLPARSDPTNLNFEYTFDDAADGAGVDVYVVDTGILVTHEDYGGRAKFAFSAPGLPKTDDNGHGSHCAGTIGGTQFGIAKQASIFAVKVLDNEGSGATSDIISGINFVVDAARLSKRPSVLSMSLGGSPSRAIDQAVIAAVNAGVHVVVAAGNENQDAKNVSPARVPEVITVGASDIDDTIAVFSNFGTGVDIFAPGVSVTSVGIRTNTDTATFDGTSMACPHVAGLVAVLLSQNPDTTPQEMSLKIQAVAANGLLRGLPRGTQNRLAQVGLVGGAQQSQSGNEAAASQTTAIPRTVTATVFATTTLAP